MIVKTNKKDNKKKKFRNVTTVIPVWITTNPQ